MIELVHTSAPRGLAAGSSGYCSVGWTDGIPANYIAPLEQFSGYKILYNPGDKNEGLNPVSMSWQTRAVGARRMGILSRVAYSGLDYTGRTNKLAHHIIPEPGDSIPSAGPAALFLTAGNFYEKWEGEPRLLARRQLKTAAPPPPGVPDAWRSRGGDAAWPEIIAGAFQRAPDKPVYIEFEPAPDHSSLSLALVREICAFLHSPAAMTFNTYFVSVPPGDLCFLRFCPDGAAALASARRTPGALVISLVSPSPAPAELLEALKASRAKAAAQKAPVQIKTPEPAESPAPRAPRPGPPEDEDNPPRMEKHPVPPPNLRERIAGRYTESFRRSYGSAEPETPRAVRENSARMKIFLAAALCLCFVLGFLVFYMWLRTGRAAGPVGIDVESPPPPPRADKSPPPQKPLGPKTQPPPVSAESFPADAQPPPPPDRPPAQPENTAATQPKPVATPEKTPGDRSPAKVKETPPKPAVQPPASPEERIALIKFLRQMKEDARGRKHSGELPLSRVSADSKIQLEADTVGGASPGQRECFRQDGRAAEILAVRTKKDEYGAVQSENAGSEGVLRVEPAGGGLVFTLTRSASTASNIKFPAPDDIKAVSVDGVKISAVYDDSLSDKLPKGSWNWSPEKGYLYNQSEDEKIFGVTAAPDPGLPAFVDAVKNYNAQKPVDSKAAEAKIDKLISRLSEYNTKLDALLSAKKTLGEKKAKQAETDKDWSQGKKPDKNAKTEAEKAVSDAQHQLAAKGKDMDDAADACAALLADCKFLNNSAHADLIRKALRNRQTAAPNKDELKKSLPDPSKQKEEKKKAAAACEAAGAAVLAKDGQNVLKTKLAGENGLVPSDFSQYLKIKRVPVRQDERLDKQGEN